jgi:hypothetical protein
MSAAQPSTRQPRRRVPEGLRRALPMLVLVRKQTDAQIAADWGLEAWQVACSRTRIGLPNHAGWPCGDEHLRRLVLVERLTDAEIAARYAVGPRAVEARRLRLDLRRPNDPRPEARRTVVVIRRAEPSPLDRALDGLGSRVKPGRHGSWTLDGRHVGIVEVLRAGGAA